jgi:hypothetical protein
MLINVIETPCSIYPAHYSKDLVFAKSDTDPTFFSGFTNLIQRVWNAWEKTVYKFFDFLMPADIKALKTRSAELQAEHSDLMARLTENRKTNDNLRRLSSQLHEKSDRLSFKRLELLKDISLKQAKEAALEAEVATLKARGTMLADDTNKKTNHLIALRHEISGLKETISLKQKMVHELENHSK